jgi:hypothetical protein
MYLHIGRSEDLDRLFSIPPLGSSSNMEDLSTSTEEKINMLGTDVRDIHDVVLMFDLMLVYEFPDNLSSY